MRYSISKELRAFFLKVLPELSAPGMTYRTTKKLMDELENAPEISEPDDKPAEEAKKA